MSSTPVVADGSALADAGERVVIDPDGDEPWRYRCPRGHTTWAPTNSHVWCKSCREQADAGEDVDPEWYELLDSKTGERIDYARIEVIEGR